MNSLLLTLIFANVMYSPLRFILISTYFAFLKAASCTSRASLCIIYESDVNSGNSVSVNPVTFVLHELCISCTLWTLRHLRHRVLHRSFLNSSIPTTDRAGCNSIPRTDSIQNRLKAEPISNRSSVRLVPATAATLSSINSYCEPLGSALFLVSIAQILWNKSF